MTVKIYDDGSSYAWTPEMGKDGIIIRMSKSTLTAPSWCAQQLWLQHNYPRKQGLVKHLILGEDVHSGLEIFYDNLWKDADINELHEQAKRGGDISKQLLKYIPNKEAVVNYRRDDNKEFPFYDEDYYRNMEWLMAYETARMTMAKTPMPLANEVRLELRREVEVPGYGTIPIQFIGIIDRIFEAPDGGLMVFELKTGKWSDAKLSGMRKEMSYYKFLIDNADPAYLKERGIDRTVTHWGWRYSSADHWNIEPVKSISDRAMMKSMRDLIKMYLDQEFLPTKADFKCGYCEYIELCPKYAIPMEGGA